VGLTVIVSSYNQLSTLPIVLQSFAKQTVLPEKVIVSDDGSTDGTIEWLDSLPDMFYPYVLAYTSDKHRGYALAVIQNNSAKYVDGGRLLFTNADVIHNPTSIEAHLHFPENVFSAGLIKEIPLPYSQDVNLDNVSEFRSFESTFKTKLSKMTNYEFMIRNPRINIYGMWGGNISIDIFRFKFLRGFNEEYLGKYGGEEADLINRFMKLGGDVAWAHNSISYHLGHKKRQYHAAASGIKKYKEEYLNANNSNKRGWGSTTNREWI
jgi:glycosyltransferase involved in cell wall biosynthesis